MAIVPMSLAVGSHGTDLPGSIDNDDHERVVKQAWDWQQATVYASFWEMGAVLKGIARDRIYALTGQMASTGERLSLAHAAGVEVALWRDFRETADPDPVHEMRMRAMGETQCMFVIGTGHALANVAAQALAIGLTGKSENDKRLSRRLSVPDFDPFSNDRRAWVSMNQQTCDRRAWVSMNQQTCATIEAVARSSDDHDLQALVKPVVEFGRGRSWRDLDERRGEDFHRWRLQTHGISGVPRSTPWSGADGVGVLKIGHPAYKEAHGLSEETARIATDAMLDIAKAMEGFAGRWTPPGSSIRNGLTDSMIQ